MDKLEEKYQEKENSIAKIYIDRENCKHDYELIDCGLNCDDFYSCKKCGKVYGLWSDKRRF